MARVVPLARWRAVGSLYALLLSSCEAYAYAAPTATRPVNPSGPTRCPWRLDGEHPVGLTWTQIQRAPTCWFFAGPGDIGRDDRYGNVGVLGRQGDRAWLDIGAYRFEGRIERDFITLSRTSVHDYEGEWRVDETLTGRIPPRGPCRPLSVRYTYTECAPPGQGDCPNHCRLSATLRVASR
ncbi:MAG: hypothetical protein NZ898_04880 [Myxococcota bacterium]|nr:hypothetical protein [Myxococcota bacterium]MDW8362864.1 hypothetical protein [Myxococcales bacterium]